MAKETVHTFPKIGDKMFIITYDENNIDNLLTVHLNGTRNCMYIKQEGNNGSLLVKYESLR